MRYLKTYRIFEAAKTGLTPEQEAFLNRHTWHTGWTYDPATGLVDVKDELDCRWFNIDSDKWESENFHGIRFGKVGQNFDCEGNNLTSLKGAPKEVGGYFRCGMNNLTTLEGAPQKVGGLYCSYNKLTSLEGAPQEVGGNFGCGDNKLTSLEGAPQVVGGDFDCKENNLTSLEGAPQEVGGGFNCKKNNLTTLEGAPQEVGGNFSCSWNKLTSLEGAPQEVGGDFSCWENNLTSLEGAPQEVGGYFGCNAFKLEKGQWNPKGWLKVLKEGNLEAQKLILTILSPFPEVLNKEIQQDPAGMAMKLKVVWNDKSFRETRDQLVWPKGYQDQADLVGDLDDIGF
jgi:hypothetical protein